MATILPGSDMGDVIFFNSLALVQVGEMTKEVKVGAQLKR